MAGGKRSHGGWFARLRRGGWRWACRAAWDRLAPDRPRCFRDVQARLEGQQGLEIGGPSRVFQSRGVLPIYPRIARLDNVNFAAETAWERAAEGAPFRFHRRKEAGLQRLREATSLHGIADGVYDFVLSSHCLEHVANPLAALHEWRRVTRAGGHLLLVLPDPPKTFDHRRPVTTLAHLREDLARGTTEADETHFAEVLALHDLTRDAGVASDEEFRARTLRNLQNRCVHHHVFDLDLLRAVLAETGWRVLATETAQPMHLVAFARKETP